MDETFYKLIDKLIDDLPNEYKNPNDPIVIDLILDSGVFNGAYIIGVLYFLKEMENRNYLKIERISGCSIGSLCGFLYLTDNLDVFYNCYNKFVKYFKKKYNLKIITKLKKILFKHVNSNSCDIINNRLFIKYNNIGISKNNSIVKSIYKNNDEIYESIIASCFFPLLIDGNLSKNNNIDGINPFIFEKNDYKKILFLDLIGIDKFIYTLNIKNEKSCFYRIVYGLIDIQRFFTKKSSTFMCSYVNDWNFLNNLYFNVRIIFEKLICFIVHYILFIKKYILYICPNINYHLIKKFTYRFLKNALDKCF